MCRGQRPFAECVRVSLTFTNFPPLFEREGERNGRERCSETLAEEPQEAVLVGVEEAPAIQLPLQNVWVRTLAHL